MERRKNRHRSRLRKRSITGRACFLLRVRSRIAHLKNSKKFLIRLRPRSLFLAEFQRLLSLGLCLVEAARGGVKFAQREMIHCRFRMKFFRCYKFILHSLQIFLLLQNSRDFEMRRSLFFRRVTAFDKALQQLFRIRRPLLGKIKICECEERGVVLRSGTFEMFLCGVRHPVA